MSSIAANAKAAGWDGGVEDELGVVGGGLGEKWTGEDGERGKRRGRKKRKKKTRATISSLLN